MRANPGLDEREVGAMAGFNPSKTAERVDNRGRLLTRHFWHDTRPGGTPFRSCDNPFHREIGTPRTQHLQPLLVTAKLGELRFLGLGAGLFFASAVVGAHRMERPAFGAAVPARGHHRAQRHVSHAPFAGGANGSESR